MNNDQLLVRLMATIQSELARLHEKHSAKHDATSILTSLKFHVYQDVPTVEIQFDVLNNTLGATYWGIDLSPIEACWSLNGYVYRDRDEMVFAVEKILEDNLEKSRNLILETIHVLDSEISKYL